MPNFEEITKISVKEKIEAIEHVRSVTCTQLRTLFSIPVSD